MMQNPKQRQRRWRGKEGAALMVTMLVVLVGGLAAGGFFAYSANSAYQSQTMAHGMQALAIAEAGAADALQQLVEDYTLRTSDQAFPETAFGGGTYDVTISNNAHQVVLISAGTYRGATATVGMDIRDRLREPGPPSWKDFAIFANGDLNFNGSPDIDGDVHTNQDWDLNGNYSGVDASISAQNEEAIPEAFRREWTLIPFPDLNDPEMQALVQAADDAGALDYWIASGKKAYRGPKNLNMDGVIIVLGDLEFNGSGTRNLTGLMYVTGDVTFNGSGELNIEGSLLAGGEVRFNGGSAVFSYADVTGEEDEGEDPDTIAEVELYAVW